MNTLPTILGIIDTVDGPIAKTTFLDLEAIRQEYRETGLVVPQDYIAGFFGHWKAMRSYTCETRMFDHEKDAINWLAEDE